MIWELLGLKFASRLLKPELDVGKLIFCADEGARYTPVSTAWLCFMCFAL